ncbi:caspase-3-like [Dysidea avara]|uniref:caspase-3-like n=1 Tax=Dysidea avara TaxID=196820 RepID=UPI0033303E8B
MAITDEQIRYDTPAAHIGNKKSEYYRYIEDQHIGPSIVESGTLPQHIIHTKEETNKKLQNEVNILKQRLDESKCEKEKLFQKINDYEQINKDQLQAMQLYLQAQNKLGTAESYPMDKQPHGLAVLIINSNFHSRNAAKRTLPDRNGSLVDEDNLRKLWMYLLYEVIVLRNITALELVSELRKISQLDHRKYDSFVLCISSHGCPDGVYEVDGEPVSVGDITELFTVESCPTLVNKPKLLFIQSCCISQSALGEVDF